MKDELFGVDWKALLVFYGVLVAAGLTVLGIAKVLVYGW